MKRVLLVAAAILAAVSVKAQKFPVGIVSVQDTTKSVQVGVISSVATDGGHGLQLSTFSNTSGATFNGVQLSAITNMTQNMYKGVQLGGMLNVASGDQYRSSYQWRMAVRYHQLYQRHDSWRYAHRSGEHQPEDYHRLDAVRRQSEQGEFRHTLSKQEYL